jgi:hypothetical protein
MKTKRIVTAEYSVNGYTVFINGQPHYSAGNCVHDSAVHLVPGEPGAAVTGQIRRWCQKTAWEIAVELNAELGEIERVV